MLRKVTFVALLASMLAACGASTEPTTPRLDSEPTDAAPTSTVAATSTVPATTPTTESKAEATPTAVAVELPETLWTLTSLNGAIIDTGATITLSFIDGQTPGNTGCNGYGSDYTASADGNLSFGEIEMTEIYCNEPAGIMDLESSYIDALNEIERYHLTDTRLKLANAGGEVILIFTSRDRSNLNDTSWTLITLDGESPVADTRVTIDFTNGRISGSGGCNDYNGAYSASTAGDVALSGIAITAEDCLEPVGILEQEVAFVDALGEITAYQLDGDNRLKLLNRAGEVRMVFTNHAEPAGIGQPGRTDWVLTSLNGETLDPEMTITLMLNTDTFSGQSGCLTYSGQFTPASDSAMRYVKLFAPYDGSCEAAADEVAMGYLDTLETVARRSPSTDRLELLNSEGETILVYRPALTDSGLDETEWTLRSLNGSAPVEETTITLMFIDGWATGSAGCNGYGGEYVVLDPGVLSIPNIIITTMLCGDPQGIMDQEGSFRETLLQAVTYELTDSTLEIMNAAGETTLVFERGIQ